MILQALTAYYEQLLKQGKVEAPGWDSKFKVSYELRLGPDGQLLALNDLRQEVPKGKKTVNGFFNILFINSERNINSVKACFGKNSILKHR